MTGPAPINANLAHAESLAWHERLALWAVARVGTLGFFSVCVALATIPILAPATMPVVQYASSGYLQLVLLPLILAGQNLQGRHDGLRAERDYEVDVRAEAETREMLAHQRRQTELLERIAAVLILPDPSDGPLPPLALPEEDGGEA